MIELGYLERRRLQQEIARKEAELDSLYIKIADGCATERDHTRRRCIEVSIESMKRRLKPKYSEAYDFGIGIMR